MADNLKVPVDFIIDYAKNKQKILKSLKDLQKDAKFEIDIEVELDAVKAAISELSDLASAIKKVSGSMQEVGQEKGIRALLTGLKGEVDDLASFGSVFKSTIDFAKKMGSEVINLNKSMVEFQRVTGYSESQTKDLLKTYIEIGKQLGVSSKEVAANASTWLKQGHSISKTTDLIKNAIILSKIGQLEAAESTEYLTNIMNGQKLAVSDVIEVVDKLAATQLASSLDMSGIAAAMSTTSSSAHLAGVSLDNLIGYLTAVGEATDTELSSIGQSFEEIFSKYETIKLGDFIDESGMDISDEINQIEVLLANAGITLRNTKGEFKDFDAVIKEISTNWSDFSRLEQNALVDTLAGNGNRESFVALMNNYGTALEYAGTAAGSSGEALKSFEVHTNGLEASLERFGTAFESLVNNTINSDLIKWFIDAGTSITTFIDKAGGLNALVAIGAGFLSLKNVGRDTMSSLTRICLQ